MAKRKRRTRKQVNMDWTYHILRPGEAHRSSRSQLGDLVDVLHEVRHLEGLSSDDIETIEWQLECGIAYDFKNEVVRKKYIGLVRQDFDPKLMLNWIAETLPYDDPTMCWWDENNREILWSGSASLYHRVMNSKKPGNAADIRAAFMRHPGVSYVTLVKESRPERRPGMWQIWPYITAYHVLRIYHECKGEPVQRNVELNTSDVDRAMPAPGA